MGKASQMKMTLCACALAVGLLFSVNTGLAQEWTWTGPVNVSGTSRGSTSPDLAVSEQGAVHVVWEDNTRLYERYDGAMTVKDILYAKYNGATWSEPVQLSAMDTISTFSTDPKIALDSQGRPHVVWNHNGTVPSGRVFYSALTNTGWSEPFNFTNDEVYSGWDPDIVIDSDDRLHLVWDGVNDQWFYDICYRSLKDGIWSDTVHITHMRDRDAASGRIAIDSQDRVHLVWWTLFPDYLILYSILEEGVWTPAESISTPGLPAVDRPVIALDSQDRPHIAWHQRDCVDETCIDYINRVYYTCLTDTGWMEPEDVLPEPANLYMPRQTIAVSKADIPIIGVNYYEGDEWAHSSLLFRIEDEWTFPEPYKTGSHSTSQSIVLDDSNTIHSVITDNRYPGFYPEILYFRGDRVLSVPQRDMPFPESYAVLSSYPNPFNSTALIQFQLPTASDVTLTVYNLRGERVRRLVSSSLPSGLHVRQWSGLNERGDAVGSGVYFIHLTTAHQTLHKRITLIR
jgi:hypothetical protein